MPDDLWKNENILYIILSFLSGTVGWLIDGEGRTKRETVGVVLGGVLLGVVAGNVALDRNLTDGYQLSVVFTAGILAPFVIELLLYIGKSILSDRKKIVEWIKSKLKRE